VRNEAFLLGSASLGALAALLLSIPTARGDANGRTIGVSELHTGMKGYGLTVFHGTEPERFDVELIGVQHNFRAGQDLILVKTPHPRLDILKTVAGMSGSPIYFDGRMAGAYSYSLAGFETEPVAGVTPIALMLQEMSRPLPPGFFSAPLGHSAPHAAASHADEAPRGGELGAPLSTPLMLGGIGDRSAAALRTMFEPYGLEPLQAGGGQRAIPAGAPEHYVDGGAIGVDLVRGDVSMLGLGTVTHVEGTKLVAFGHPMMNGGASKLPTCIGEVMWVLASAQRSFKIGECVRPKGALIQDRQTTIVIDETRTAPMFPVSFEVAGVEGVTKKTWHMEVAEERFLSANLTAAAIGSAIEATLAEQRDASWQLSSHVTLRTAGGRERTVDLEDFGVAIGGMPEQGDVARLRVGHTLGDMLNNPWEEVAIEKVDATMTVKYERDVWHLRGASLLTDTVDAGKQARIRLHLAPFHGPEIIREVEIPIPLELAGTEAEIEIAPGYEVVPDLAAPESLPELIANEQRQSLAPKTIVLQVKLPSQSILLHGELAPQLPDFAMDALRAVHSDVGAEAVATYARAVIPLEHYVDGHDKLKVKVRRPMR
jgi:hypothetical protein